MGTHLDVVLMSLAIAPEMLGPIRGSAWRPWWSKWDYAFVWIAGEPAC
jgi:hypothetical protein